MQNMMYTSVGGKFITPLQIPGDYHPNMGHLELIEAQITKEGMLAYESITEASLAGYQEMILFKGVFRCITYEIQSCCHSKGTRSN